MHCYASLHNISDYRMEMCLVPRVSSPFLQSINLIHLLNRGIFFCYLELVILFHNVV